MDVREKNPEWRLGHELTDHYEMKDLSPNSFDKLSDRILEDEQMAIRYSRTQTLGGPDPKNYLY